MSDDVKKRNSLTLKEVDGKTKDRVIAEAYMSPETVNASVVTDWGQRWVADLSLNDSIAILREKAEKVRGGDLSDMEATLVSQVRSLDMIFSNLAARAANTQNVDFMEKYLRLALKAQAQARTTVEALHEMKYPRQAFFIGQQYNAEQQQVNNAIGTRMRPRPRESVIPKNGNELLEATDGERLDSGTAAAAGRADPHLAAMGSIDRRKDRRGKG